MFISNFFMLFIKLPMSNMKIGVCNMSWDVTKAATQAAKPLVPLYRCPCPE